LLAAAQGFEHWPLMEEAEGKQQSRDSQVQSDTARLSNSTISYAPRVRLR
jgi:hypothetical protein